MKKYFIWSCLLMMPFIVTAEPSLTGNKKKNSGFDKRRILIGPGLGAGAAQNAFSFNISPSVAYAFHENFYAGTTLGFNYYQLTERYQNYLTFEPEVFKHKYIGYTWSIFARYMLKNFLLVNFEPEINNSKFVRDYLIDWNTGKIKESKTRVTVPSLLVGLAYLQRFGQYGHTFFGVNYDLLQNPNSRYYQTLDMRFGIMLQLFN